MDVLKGRRALRPSLSRELGSSSNVEMGSFQDSGSAGDLLGVSRAVPEAL